jgi:RNA recognition motif-containing protein
MQRIARKPESGNGDSSVLPCHRLSSSWKQRAEPGRTLFVHGLGCEINCDKVFNMFCLYGNVTAVKVMKDKQVLVELNDVEAAERCVSNLHLLPLGQKTKIKVK